MRHQEGELETAILTAKLTTSVVVEVVRVGMDEVYRGPCVQWARTQVEAMRMLTLCYSVAALHEKGPCQD